MVAVTDEGPRTEEDRGRISRRQVLSVSVGVGLGLAGLSSLAAAVRLVPRIVVMPTQEPPAAGDLLVVAQGSQTGQVLTPKDIPAGAAPVFAWPMDPRSTVVKSGTTHNLIVLVRAADPGWYGAGATAHTAQGVAAYSAICTHLCCTVSDWNPAPSGSDTHGFLVCPCHLSRFDPWAGARVLAGPAPRPLPALPLTMNGQGRLIVAGDFLASVGCAT